MSFKHISLATLLYVAGCACSPEGMDDSGTGGIDTDTFTSTDDSGESESGSNDQGSGPRFDLPDFTTSDGDLDDDGGCVDVTVDVEPVIPTLVMLIDQSGSMTSDFNGVSRWNAVYDTLMDSTDGVVLQLEDRVRFGLALYTSNGGDAGGTCPMMVEEPPVLNNYVAIDTTYAPEGPGGDTPTGDSIDVVAATLMAFPEPGPKGIVLATDGEPDTCEVPNPQTGQAEAIAAAQNAYTDGISTYIISVGNQVSEQHLQEMANAGVGKLPTDMMDPAPFYQALDSQQLVDAFQAIIAEFVSCEFTLNGEITGDPCDGTIEIDGQEIDCGVDWDATSSDTIELLGDACELIKDGEDHTIEVTFPCGSVEVL